jgi:23S rRNA pseudouridine1911/1915/1917 synthase
MSNEFQITPPDAGTRLDKWLAAPERLGSRGRATTAIARGQVFVDDVEQRPSDGGRTLKTGDRVRLWLDRPGTATRRGGRRQHGLDIVFEDDRLLVVNKPAGLLTVPLDEPTDEPSLAEAVTAHWRSHGKRGALVVHRIDRDTSGLVVFAKDDESWRKLKQQFLRRTPERIYLAIVEGRPAPPTGTWSDWLRWDGRALRQRVTRPGAEGAIEAVTHYATSETFAFATLLELRLETGRQHQIRVQAWRHGHPLLGERDYRDADRGAPTEFARQALHARQLAFEHPHTGRGVRFEAAVPDDFRHLLRRLRAADRGSSGPRAGSVR